MIETGISIPGLVRDMLVEKGLTETYDEALEFSQELNERLSDIFSGTDEDIKVSFNYKSIKLLFGIEVDLYRKSDNKD